MSCVHIYIYITIQTCGKLRYQTHVTCRKLIFFSKRSFKAIKSWIFSVDQPVVQVARCPSCTRKFRSLWCGNSLSTEEIDDLEFSGPLSGSWDHVYIYISRFLNVSIYEWNMYINIHVHVHTHIYTYMYIYRCAYTSRHTYIYNLGTTNRQYLKRYELDEIGLGLVGLDVIRLA